MKILISMLLTVLLGVLALLGCAQSTSDEGSESHWLRECNSDSQCALGECICGVCTRSCATVEECPYPLDECVAGDTFGSCETSPPPSVCAVSNPGRLELASVRQTSLVECDQGRRTELHFSRESHGATAATVDGDAGFFVFGGTSTGGVFQVDADGAILRELPIPSDLAPWITDVVRTTDGGALVAGEVDTFQGDVAWVGKVDAGWSLVWETLLGPANAVNVELIALPDGGAIVGTSLTPDWSSDLVYAYLARVRDGGVLAWEHQLLMENGQWDRFQQRLVLAPGGQISMVWGGEDGLYLLRSDLDGKHEVKWLAVSLGYWPNGLAALPDGGLAVVSAREAGAILSRVDAAGEVLWEQSYGRETWAGADAVVYSPTRDEIVLAGEHRGEDGGTVRTWIIATDLDGNQTWELTRKPLDTVGDGLVKRLAADRGPSISDLAVLPDGLILAQAQDPFELLFFLLDTGTCAD